MSVSNYHRMLDDLRNSGIKPSRLTVRVNADSQVCSGARGAPPRDVSTHTTIKRGRRTFAVHVLSLTEKIAAQSNKRGNWDKLTGTATRARVIRNYR